MDTEQIHLDALTLWCPPTHCVQKPITAFSPATACSDTSTEQNQLFPQVTRRCILHLDSDGLHVDSDGLLFCALRPHPPASWPWADLLKVLLCIFFYLHLDFKYSSHLPRRYPRKLPQQHITHPCCLPFCMERRLTIQQDRLLKCIFTLTLCRGATNICIPRNPGLKDQLG